MFQKILQIQSLGCFGRKRCHLHLCILSHFDRKESKHGLELHSRSSLVKKCLESSFTVIFPLCAPRGGGGGNGGARPPKKSEREGGRDLSCSSRRSAILKPPLRTFEGVRARFPPAPTQSRTALTMLWMRGDRVTSATECQQCSDWESRRSSRV